jgi:hypothetical protein
LVVGSNPIAASLFIWSTEMLNKCILALLLVLLLSALVPGCNMETTQTQALTGSLQVLVLDENDVPLSGAKVVSNSQPGGQIKVTGITDANGMVTFNHIATGEYQFYISRFDYLPIEATLTVIADQTKTITINLTLETHSTIIPTNALHITFTDLISQPERYKDQFIVIDGYWFDGFEIAVLAEYLEPSSFAPGNVQPAGTLIWIQGGLSEEVSQQLYLQPDNPTGYPAHYGKVELTGKLEYGGKYGHLDSYEFQLTVYESQLLP